MWIETDVLLIVADVVSAPIAVMEISKSRFWGCTVTQFGPIEHVQSLFDQGTAKYDGQFDRDALYDRGRYCLSE